MRFGSKDLALLAVSASLYAAVNIVQTSLGGPVTYGPIQLRLADCLIPLSALFDLPWVFGVSLGCLSNAYYALDPADIVVGPLVNFAAALVMYILRRHMLAASFSGALTVGVPIGFYLYYLYVMGNPVVSQPVFGGFALPVWLAFVLSLSVSSIIVIAVLGYILLSALSKSSVVGPLRSRGLKIPSEK